METALAQLGATFFRHAIKNRRAQQDKDLVTLLRNFTQDQSAPTSVGISDAVTDDRANASDIPQLPVVPRTSDGDSGLNYVLKPDTQSYVVPRAPLNRGDFTLTENDFIRNDQITLPRDQYLHWRQIHAEDNAHTSVLDRIVAAAKRLNMLKEEEIGSMPLEMTYFYLFSNYQEYRFGKSVPSFTKKIKGPCNVVLHELFAEEWEHFSERTKLRHRHKLQNQLYIGRRWSIAVDHLSSGVILLAGKKISTLIHQKEFNLSDLEDTFTHIEKHYVQFIDLYKKADSLEQKSRASGTIHLPDVLSELNEIDSLLCQGQKQVHH